MAGVTRTPAAPAAPAAVVPCVHRPERTLSRRALGWALGITVVFTVVEVAGAFVSGSLALLADAGHMLTDAGALALSLFAAWVAGRPASATKTYGYYRVEILAALVNGAVLLAVTGWIVAQAVARLRTPEAVRPGILVAVASAGLLANVVALVLLHRGKGESLNARGAYLHVLSDVVGSLGAILAGGVILATGWLRADPLISIGLSGLLLVSAGRLVWQSVDVLLEAAPAHVSMTELEAAIAAVPSVRGVHDLHVWTVTSGIVAMSGHATVPDATRHQAVLEEITRRVKDFGIQHVTVQLEREEIC
jgi:cobalt-zinc-cadmium efflux system protein